MLVNGVNQRTIWLKGDVVQVINQNLLPHEVKFMDLQSVDDIITAICDMYIRGAGLIGVTAAYGIYLAAQNSSSEGYWEEILHSAERIKRARPTASNLSWAVNRMVTALKGIDSHKALIERARVEAELIADEDAESCRQIGLAGVDIIRKIYEEKGGEIVNILTHCNAGWLAFTDYGSATAPIYEAQKAGIPIHVWVDETRPRNQGARLTAWELCQQGVSHSLIADNTGGHLMQHGMVDLVITGADRVTRSGDAANKIGTYLKALAAKDNAVPFYVALPSSTFDFTISDGVREIPIEERTGLEVTHVLGYSEELAKESAVRISPEGTTARNWGFDVTPARLITGLISERGVCRADESSIVKLYPEAGDA